MASPTDAELARQALAGSQEAYRTLVGRYASAAVSFAARMVRDRGVAEDLAQEAFARAFDRLDTFDEQYRFSAWFFRILHNLAIDHLRRSRVATVSLDSLVQAGHPGLSSGQPGDWPEGQAEQAALGRALDAALGHLRPEYRAAVVLRYRQELSVQEIGDLMQVPVGTVKTYLFRARKELATILRERGWGPAEAVETASGRVP